MELRIAETEAEIAACHAVMRELRTQLTEREFFTRVQAQEADGYRLLMGEDEGRVVAVAGFRIGRNLAWGHFLYVDDLVTAAALRSRGYGTGMLAWLRRYAVDQGCGELHLDSGLQRTAAHRFYEREGMVKASYHFVERLPAGG